MTLIRDPGCISQSPKYLYSKHKNSVNVHDIKVCVSQTQIPYYKQCCRSRSGIWCRSGSGMGKDRIRNNTQHISKNIEIIFMSYKDMIQTGMEKNKDRESRLENDLTRDKHPGSAPLIKKWIRLQWYGSGSNGTDPSIKICNATMRI
jgi:hypothetical protein